MAIIFALLCVIFKSSKALVFRSSMKKTDDVWTLILCYDLFATILSLAIFSPEKIISLNLNQLVIVLCMSASWICGNIYNLKSSKFLDAASGELYGAVQFILVTVLGVIIFNESLGVVGTLGIFLVLFGIIMSNNFKTIMFNSGVFYRITSAVFITIGIFYCKLAIELVDKDTVIICSYLIPTFYHLITKPKLLNKIVPTIKQTRGMIALGGFANVISFLFFVLALEVGSVVLVNTLAQLHLILIFILGIVLLGEKTALFRKGASCALSSIGAVLVCQS